LANGLKFTAEGKIEKRSELQNNTSFYFKIGEKSLWDYMVWRKAENRIVPNRTMEQISYLTGIDLQLAYCPFSYYTVDRGEKHYRYLSAPLFRLRYRQGFDILENKNNSLFHSIDFNVSQSIRLSYFDNFSYDFSAGTFLGDVSKTDFIDYRHFNASGVLLGSKPVQNGFVLLDPYSHSTSKYWGALHLNYRTQYLLLKRIPFLQRRLFTENLHLKALYTPDKPFYTEAGYSINMMNIVSLSAFTAFNDFEYQKICFSISLSFAFLGL
jgi:hypothetical protein